MQTAKIPTALKVVAVLFILGGVSAIVDMLIQLTDGTLKINFGVLGLFIGPGLLRLRPGWRTCGLVMLWIGMILLPIFTVAILFIGVPGSIDVFGFPIGTAPAVVVSAWTALFFALAVWEYRVLTRPDVRALFGLTNAAPPVG
jgi:hypothetical protein